MSVIYSQQVSWLTVQEYVTPLLELVGSWPMVGTPAWCQLADDDPLKLAALFDAAQHWSLRLEICQAAQCEAGRDIAAAADWAAVARDVRTQSEFYAARPWMKRVAA